MKRLTLLLFLLLIFTAAYCGDTAAKTPSLGIDPSALGAAQKEKDKEQKEIDALLEKYKAASDADKKNIKAELTQKITAREEARIKREREEIARQQEKLKTWSAVLDNEEKNKTALVNTETDNLITGKKTEAPWEKLKAATEKKSGDIKNKALQKAAEVKK
ncbi:MAG: hypothetical protein LBI01_00890 [Elusimicrobium sp.]|jgi:hypothetical protein|nr:hypothetical protein [Elusimicrobium sp.]